MRCARSSTSPRARRAASVPAARRRTSPSSSSAPVIDSGCGRANACPPTGWWRRAGGLVRDAEALDLLARVDTLLVDKTGTLTEGKPRVTEVVPVADASVEELLAVAAGLERGSEHPLAAAVLAAAAERGIAPAPV